MDYSILYKTKEELQFKEPEYFKNLFIDQIVNAICNGEYKKLIYPYFISPLKNKDNIIYRLDVFKDLENENNYDQLLKLSTGLVKEYDDYKTTDHTTWVGRRNQLKHMKEYFNNIEQTYLFLANGDIKSEALIGLRDFLKTIIEDTKTKKIKQMIEDVTKTITSISYTSIIKGNDIYITKQENDEKFAPKVIERLGIFNFDIEIKEDTKTTNYVDTKNVDEAQLTALSHIYKKEFESILAFSKSAIDYYDERLYKLAIDIRFYINYIVFMNKIKTTNLSFCYPQFIDNFNEESVDSYDLALAHKLMLEHGKIVTNSYELKENERMIILSGPNQGGKTTFARQLGQLHFLASLGLMVPGIKASIHLCDSIYTFFKSEENIDDLNGKLQIELTGIKDIITNATKDSFLIFNEIFASTTAVDGLELGQKIADMIKSIGCLCLFITFLDNLATYNEITTQMVSNVCKDNPEIRTFKITKNPSDGIAYAYAIANKYMLSYDDIKRRIKK